MQQATIIGIDLAKNTFQLHGAAADGSVVFRKKLSRAKVLPFLATHSRATVAMEACASAHHWGREIAALGHEVRLIAPIYMKPFVKRQKNDTADAEAIAEAASRPTMRFVAVKSAEQQGQGMLFRTRDLLVRQRTQTINALRGHPAEFGIVAAHGPARVEVLMRAVEDELTPLPEMARDLARLLLGQVAELGETLGELERGDPPGAEGREDRASHDAPRRGCDLRDSNPRLRAVDEHVRQRARFRRLGRADAATEFDRRQGQAGEDLADGAAGHPPPADHRRLRRGDLGSSQGPPARQLACAHDGPQAPHAGGGRACEQDGAN